MALFPQVQFQNEEVTEFDDTHGNKFYVIEHEGYYLAKKPIALGKIPDPRKNIPDVIRMEVRSDDVFLVAYPKAGTHWTWEITTMLLQDSIEYVDVPKETTMLPFQTPEKILQIPSPRALNSHCFFRHLPKDILKLKNKLIFVTRNPKDIAVSYYHHCKRQIDYSGTFSEFLDFFMSEKVYHCAWYKYMLEWEQVLEQHPEIPVIVLHYEDLHRDFVGEVDRLAKFLGVQKSTDFYKKMAENCSFSQLKESYKERSNLQFMFRKGVVGDWKNWFTVSDNEKFDKFLIEKMSNSKWTFKYQ